MIAGHGMAVVEKVSGGDVKFLLLLLIVTGWPSAWMHRIYSKYAW